MIWIIHFFIFYIKISYNDKHNNTIYISSIHSTIYLSTYSLFISFSSFITLDIPPWLCITIHREFNTHNWIYVFLSVRYTQIRDLRNLGFFLCDSHAVDVDSVSLESVVNTWYRDQWITHDSYTLIVYRYSLFTHIYIYAMIKMNIEVNL